MLRTISITIAAGIVAASAGLARAEGDAEAGMKAFNRCKACHDAEKETNKVGPHLVGVYGRKAGGLEDFSAKYSDAMKKKGEEGLVWDDETLAAYMTDPKGYIPGNKMAFSGLKKPGDVANILAYLKSVATQ